MAEQPEKKRGPKGGIKHNPGRGHDRKSAPRKKKRFAERAKKLLDAKHRDARQAWDEWDQLPDEVKRLLGQRGSRKCRGQAMIKAVSKIEADIDAIYVELIEKFYGEGDREGAIAVAARLDAILAEDAALRISIRGEEICSIIAELSGNISQAIEAREAEIRKILELHFLSHNTPSWEYVRKQYDYSDVSDRLDLLAILYDEAGNLQRAVETLRESKSYCRSRHIPFDGEDVLAELTEAEAGADESKPGSADAEIDAAIRKAYAKLNVVADRILVDRTQGRRFLSLVKQQMKGAVSLTMTRVMERLLALRKRGSKPNGLPKLKIR